jgi:hypothetical protein
MVKECTVNKFKHTHQDIYDLNQGSLGSEPLILHVGTVTPKLLKDQDLFKAEIANQLPLRLAFLGLAACADSEGLFSWEPALLKCKILPYDDVDASEVLDVLFKGGFIKKQKRDGVLYGRIPLGNEEVSEDAHEASSATLKHCRIKDT